MSSPAAPNGHAKLSAKPSAILHRTTWRPPIASSGQGIYITLEDGTTVIDAVGGAAVASIGNGHPVVKQAVKDQVDKLSCECSLLTSLIRLMDTTLFKRRVQHAAIKRTGGGTRELYRGIEQRRV